METDFYLCSKIQVALQNEGSSASACWILDAKFRCFSCLTFLFKMIFTKSQKIRKELDISFKNLLDLIKNLFKQKSQNRKYVFSEVYSSRLHHLDAPYNKDCGRYDVENFTFSYLTFLFKYIFD